MTEYIYSLILIPIVVWLVVSMFKAKHDILFLEKEIVKTNQTTRILEEKFDQLEKKIDTHLKRIETVFESKMDDVTRIVIECTRSLKEDQ